MGFITDINDSVSVETRRSSVALMISGAVVDAGATARIEFEYADLLTVKTAVDVALQSEAYQSWTRTRKARRER
jgi:hypothetical protein